MARIKGWKGNKFYLPSGKIGVEIVTQTRGRAKYATIYINGKARYFTSGTKTYVNRWVSDAKINISRNIYG
ncbi:hypothetical protein ACFL6S_03440 [Candidatus Poribacteria bacterium]